MISKYTDDRQWLDTHLHTIEERLQSLETKVTLLSSIATQKAKKARPEEEGEVWAYMESLGGLKKEDALWFLDKMEASGWKNDGKPVASWKAVIRVWKRLAIFPSQKQQNASNGQPGASVGTLQRVLEDKKAAADKFKARHVNETAMGGTWDSAGNRALHQRSWKEIHQLQAQIDELLGLNHPTRGTAK